MINNSVGQEYRLTGNPASEPVLFQAAQSVVAVRYNTVVGCDQPSEAEVSLIYADYYFVEALRRLAEKYRRSTITYTPDAGVQGTDSFIYEACDDVGTNRHQEKLGAVARTDA